MFAFDIERMKSMITLNVKWFYDCGVTARGRGASGDHFKYEVTHLPMINSHITLDLMVYFFAPENLIRFIANFLIYQTPKENNDV